MDDKTVVKDFVVQDLVLLHQTFDSVRSDLWDVMEQALVDGQYSDEAKEKVSDLSTRLKVAENKLSSLQIPVTKKDEVNTQLLEAKNSLNLMLTNVKDMLYNADAGLSNQDIEAIEFAMGTLDEYNTNAQDFVSALTYLQNWIQK